MNLLRQKRAPGLWKHSAEIPQPKHPQVIWVTGGQFCLSQCSGCCWRLVIEAGGVAKPLTAPTMKISPTQNVSNTKAEKSCSERWTGHKTLGFLRTQSQPCFPLRGVIASVSVALLVSVSHSVVSDCLWPHVAHQAPLSMEFTRQKYWNGLPLPSPVTN